jgi:hypothetical protein
MSPDAMLKTCPASIILMKHARYSGGDAQRVDNGMCHASPYSAVGHKCASGVVVSSFTRPGICFLMISHSASVANAQCWRVPWRFMKA